jgi:3-keto-5-aminohexanoate cleavage enzyme
MITVAPTGGVHGKESNANLPTQPNEIAKEIYRSWQAGASIAHIHARDSRDKPTGNPEIFSEIKERIRSKGCDIILGFTTGGSPVLKFEERIRSLEAGPEIVSFSTGTLTVSLGGGKSSFFSTNRYQIKRLAEILLEKDIKPEIEIFNESWMREAHTLIAKQLIKKPYLINIVLGVNAQGSVEAIPKNLMRMVDILPKGSIFSVSAMGAAQLPLTTMSIILGGHPRVGMEDNIYYSKGCLSKSNAEFVERTVRIARELGRDIATPQEARELLMISKS